MMYQNPVSIPVMYSNGLTPSFNGSDGQLNPWVMATQTGYKEYWTNKIQTNISLEQKLDFITKGLRFEGRFGFDTNNNNQISRRTKPELFRALRVRNADGSVKYDRVSPKQEMTQTSEATGNRREF